MATHLGRDDTAPLCGGAKVQVIGLIEEAPSAQSLAAKVMDGQRSIAIPLELLAPAEQALEHVEAILDWQYWRRRR